MVVSKDTLTEDWVIAFGADALEKRGSGASPRICIGSAEWRENDASVSKDAVRRHQRPNSAARKASIVSLFPYRANCCPNTCLLPGAFALI